MTRTRPTTHGGRGDGRGAATSSAARLPRTGRRVGAALLAGALTTTGAVFALGGVAQAENPPIGPGNIEIFNHRDMVALEGYTAQAGERATVTVKRGGQTIGSGMGTIDETGFLEFNHPGGECWIGVTPNIKGGDLVEVSFSESAFVDGATVGSAVITDVTGSAVTATPQAGDVEGTVTITGTYGGDVDLSRFVVEVVNPEMRRPDPSTPPTTIGERAIGWVPVDDPEHPNGGPGYTATGTAANGRFEVTFGLQSAADQQRVLDGEHVVMTWLADGAGDLALGATQYEFGESDGPGFGGCPAGPGTQPPVPPTSAELTAGKDSITVTWATPAQAADAPAVSGTGSRRWTAPSTRKWRSGPGPPRPRSRPSPHATTRSPSRPTTARPGARCTRWAPWTSRPARSSPAPVAPRAAARVAPVAPRTPARAGRSPLPRHRPA